MGKTYLFFAAQYLPTAGGVERYTYNLAHNLMKAGHHAIVVTSALPNLPDYEQTPEGMEVFRLPSFLLMQGRFPVIKPNQLFFALTKKLWAKKIDFCLINTYFYPLSLYAAHACHKRGIRHILINHGSAYLMTGQVLLATMGKWYEQIAARLAYYWCKDIYGVSIAACEWMKTFGIDTNRVLSNAIEPREVQNQAMHNTIDWRTKLALASDAKMICFVGRMIAEKGVLELAQALPEIRKHNPNTVMILAGEGALFDAVLGADVEGLYCVGKQSYDDTLALFAQSDLFCLPTRSEGFACTVLEAAALACPIITTATGGSPQLLLDESYGLLLPDMSAQSIATACNRGLQDEDWCHIAGKKAQQLVQEQFTWVHVTKVLLEISA